MKRSRQEYADLLTLLDQALDLPPQQRIAWVEQLPHEHDSLREALRRMVLEASGEETGELPGLMDSVAAIVRDSTLPSSAFELCAGERIGPYELVRELGRGGMGSVWLAHRADGAFKRSVALKLPHLTWIGSFNERMARERDILSNLEHPNIARFYDAGLDALGRPFMVMEYVEGRAIDVYCREQGLSVRDRLHLVLEVAKAVAYAHSKLVVHRDLKPGNIMVTAEGEVRLLDFGLAKLIETQAVGDPQATQFAGRLLTPDYASPEQIKGERIGTSTDVYSLAVVTYELLSESRPYTLKRNSAAELEEAIAQADVRPASEAATDAARKRGLRGDLDAILNLALKKNPANRYPTVDAFAVDLQRHLAGEPVFARPDSAAYRLRKFVGRNVAAIGAAMVLLMVLVFATLFSMRQANEATLQARKATAIKDFLLHVFTAGDNRAAGSRPAGEVTALELLDEGSAQLLLALDTEPAVKLELIRAMGDIYERMDAIDKEVSLLRHGVSLADQTYGPDSGEKAELLALIAGSLDYAGRYAEAEKAVAEAERAFDASDDHTSLAYAQLLKCKGHLLRRHGPRGAAAARDTLQRAAALFASRYPNTEGHVGSLMYLAGVEITLDEIPAARAAADAAVGVARNLKKDVAELANAISLRASVEDQLADSAGAIRDYAEASALYAASVGTQGFLYLQNENLRGQAMQMAGQRDPGLRLLESSTAQIAVVRPQSNTLANALVRLAEAHLRDGNFVKANANAAAAIALESTRQNSMLWTRALLNHAAALTALGRFEEAGAEVAAAAQVNGADGMPARHLVVEAAVTAAELALAQEDWTDARRQLEAGMAALSGESRRTRHQRARVLELNSRLAAATGDGGKAMADAAGARRIAELPDLRADPFLWSAILAAEGSAQCRFAGAGGAAIDEALALQSSLLSAGSPLFAVTLADAARCAVSMRQFERAKPLLAQARRILEADRPLGPQFLAALHGLDANPH